MAVSVKGDGAEEASAVERAAALLARDGELVVRDGEVVNVTWGQAFQVAPNFDAAIERRLQGFYDRYYGISPSSFGVPGYTTLAPTGLQRCDV